MDWRGDIILHDAHWAGPANTSRVMKSPAIGMRGGKGNTDVVGPSAGRVVEGAAFGTGKSIWKVLSRDWGDSEEENWESRAGG